MKTRISCLLLLSACLLLSVLPAQRAVAHTKPKRTKFQTWSTAEYVLYVGLIVWVMMTATGECAEEEPHDFLREYGGDLARLFGPGIRLVTSSCPAAPGSRDTRMLFCRCVNSTNAFTVVASLVRDAAGRIESLSFSQDLTLPGGVAVPRNQPVPVETIMRVIMLSRRAPPALMLETLSLKSFRSSVSLRGKDASGFRVIKRVAGTVPTSYKSFNLVHTFVIGMNGPSQTNPYYHTFLRWPLLSRPVFALYKIDLVAFLFPLRAPSLSGAAKRRAQAKA
ncbi:hypothetical protein GX586_00440, partial [bacterium]|nr:hypothetical protein [bacterium]